jgi:hypothetical protein
VRPPASCSAKSRSSPRTRPRTQRRPAAADRGRWALGRQAGHRRGRRAVDHFARCSRRGHPRPNEFAKRMAGSAERSESARRLRCCSAAVPRREVTITELAATASSRPPKPAAMVERGRRHPSQGSAWEPWPDRCRARATSRHDHPEQALFGRSQRADVHSASRSTELAELGDPRPLRYAGGRACARASMRATRSSTAGGTSAQLRDWAARAITILPRMASGRR